MMAFDVDIASMASASRLDTATLISVLVASLSCTAILPYNIS